MPQHLEKPELFELKMTIGSRDLTGEDVGRLTKIIGQVLIDESDDGIETILLAKEAGAIFYRAGQEFGVEVFERRYRLNVVTDGEQFFVRHVAIDG